jgi:hypothetical protein
MESKAVYDAVCTLREHGHKVFKNGSHGRPHSVDGVSFTSKELLRLAKTPVARSDITWRRYIRELPRLRGSSFDATVERSRMLRTLTRV